MQLNNFRLLLVLLFSLETFGQNDFVQQSYTMGDKSVGDYYSGMNDKSTFQKYKIRNLKGEMNNYSGRLHDLQKRFDEIFYGLSTSGNHRKPFDLSENLDNGSAKQKYWYDSNFTRFEQRSDLVNRTTKSSLGNNTLRKTRTVPKEEIQNISDTQKTVIDTDLSPEFQARSGVGKYFILYPGVSFPYKVHNDDPVLGQSRREYVPGISLNLSTGLESETFNVGVGLQYKRNSMDKSSWFNDPSLPSGSIPPNISGRSHTFAGYVDFGFKTEINDFLDAYFGVGLGYYTTRFNSHVKESDDGFYGTGTVGLEWVLSESAKFRLGYRYAHEEEVPSHIGEAGLNFAY